MSEPHCPPALVASNATACVVPCPVPGYSHDEYDTLRTITLITNSVSLGCLLVGAVFWSQRCLVFPKTLIFHFMLALAGFHASQLSGEVLGGPDKVWCKHGFELARQHDVRCGVQGSLMLYFAWASSVWWFVLVANLFVGVVLRVKRESWMPVYALFGWGTGVPFVTAGLMLDRIGYQPYNTWCFVFSNNDRGRYIWALFFLPASVLLLVGTAFGVAVAVKLAATAWSLKSRRFGGPSTLRFHVRLLALLFHYFLLLVGFMTFQAHASVHEPEVNQAIVDWYKCQLEEFAKPTPQYSACSITTRPIYWLFAFSATLAGSCGAVLTAIFCLSRDHLRFWGSVVRRVLACAGRKGLCRERCWSPFPSDGRSMVGDGVGSQYQRAEDQ